MTADGVQRPSSPGAAPAPDEQLLAGALRVAVNRLTRRLRAERGDRSLTLSQLSALSSLEGHGPCSPTALADLERVQPPSMTRVIAALEELGLAQRAPHQSDRRQAVIAITEKGRAVLEESRQRRNAWLAQELARLSPEERALLVRAVPLLQRLADA